MEKEYYKTEASVKEYINLAKDVNSSGLIEQFKSFLPSRARILEIGSGPGTDWKLLNKDFDVTGSDFSEEFLKHLNTNNPDGRFIQLDAISLDTNEKFDGIYSNKVLQHLNDDELKKSIKRQHEILNPGGIICHSFWKGEGSEVFKGMFVNYHTAATLNTFFAEHLEVLRIESYQEFEADDSLFILGKKK